MWPKRSEINLQKKKNVKSAKNKKHLFLDNHTDSYVNYNLR